MKQQYFFEPHRHIEIEPHRHIEI